MVLFLKDQTAQEGELGGLEKMVGQSGGGPDYLGPITLKR